MGGRNKQYEVRTTLNVACEGSEKTQFQKICDQKGIDMNALIRGWIRSYVEEHKDDYHGNLDTFIDPTKSVQLPPAPEKITYTLDLSKPANIKEITDFINSLDLEHAARIQGTGRLLNNVGKIVVNKRKIGMPPIPLQKA